MHNHKYRLTCQIVAYKLLDRIIFNRDPDMKCLNFRPKERDAMPVKELGRFSISQ